MNIEEKLKCDKKILLNKSLKRFMLSLVSLFLVLSETTVSLAKLNFIDVPDNAWYYDTVDELCQSNIVNGFPDGTFGPNLKVTKGQLFKLLVMSVYPEFTPVRGAVYWLDPYTEYLKRKYVIDAIESREEYEREITREEAVYYIDKAIKLEKNLEQSRLEASYSLKVESDIKDFSEIDNKYKRQIAALVYNKFISGYEDGTFRPKSTLTRAELCALILRLKHKREADTLAGYIDVEGLV